MLLAEANGGDQFRFTTDTIFGAANEVTGCHLFRTLLSRHMELRGIRVADVKAASASLAVWQHALKMFGNEEKTTRWMATRLAKLQERTPEQVMNEDPDAVEAILERIEYGVFN